MLKRLIAFFKRLFGMDEEPETVLPINDRQIEDERVSVVAAETYEEAGEPAPTAEKKTPTFSEDGLWKGRFDRPPADDPGWRDRLSTFWSPAIGGRKLVIREWVDPNTGAVEWQDYPAQQPPTADWRFIASGNQDVGRPDGIWNARWSGAEFIDQGKTEVGLHRIRAYRGTLRSNPENWPEKYKKAYFETH